jgi:hypothetical protein
MRPSTRRAALLSTVVLAACASPTEPTADLTGSWVYTFSATAEASACPTAPTGFRAGCAGGGPVTLTQTDRQLSGTVTLSGACQDCGSVADYRGSARPVTGRWRGGDVEIEIGDCRHTAAVPRDASRVSGTVTCAFGGVTSRGTWTILR